MNDYIAEATLDKVAENPLFREETGIVYLIQNMINKKVYIGITANTFVRRYGLQFESHNDHLCRSIEKYGMNNFKVFICYSGIDDYSELQKLEKKLIKKYNSQNSLYGYNKTLGGEGTLGYKFTKEDYLRIHVPVVALNKDGSLYKEYESQKQAFDELGVYVSDCLKMRTKTAHGLIWIYKDEYDAMTADEIDERVEWSLGGITQMKAIIALDRDGNFVKEYESIIEASRELECSCGTITNCCKRKVKTYQDYIWIYKQELEKSSPEELEDIIDFCNYDDRHDFAKDNLSVPIVAIDICSGEYICTYQSAHEAEKAIGIPDANGHIIACCKGKLVSCYGYKWCYEYDYLNQTEIYRLKIESATNGRRPVVALNIKTGTLVARYDSISEALAKLKKKGGGSISMCCQGRLNYCYGYRWMYEDQYYNCKDRITEVIAELDKKKQQNHSKCRAIPVVIVWDGRVIEKNSIKEMSEFFLKVFDISNVRDWFKNRGVPKKYMDKVSFCGTLDEYKKS